MQLGIHGEVELHFTDRVTGTVEAHRCLNLITKYGLKRFLAPKDLGEQTATHLCVGYREEDASIDDDIVPSNYCSIKTSEYTHAPSTVKDSMATAYQAIFNENMPVGFRFNHMHLAYQDSDGVLHALTSLKLKNEDGSFVDYTHGTRYNVGVHYSINFNLIGVGGSSTFVTGAKLASSEGIDYVVPYLKNSLNGKGIYTEAGNTQSNPAYIKSFDGNYNEAGNWEQNYTIVVTPRANSSTIYFKIGIAYLRLNTTHGRGTEEINLKFEVKPLSELDLTPKPITNVAIKVNGNGYYVEDTRYVLITGAPFQEVEVYFGKYYLTGFYLGASGELHRTSYFTTMTDTETGAVVNVPEKYMLSSGLKIRFVSKTRNGMVEALVDTPDLQANNVQALWFINPTTLRVVSNYGDKVQITYDTSVYSNAYNIVTNPFVGNCTTEFSEDPGYYYADIELVDFDASKVQDINYICTDLAGNVWNPNSNGGKRQVYNYIPGIDYATAKKNYYRQQYEHTMYNENSNNYNLNFRVISGDIT